MESRRPRGLSSKVGPLKDVDSREATKSSIEEPERSSTPPSMALSCSCVMVAVADASRMDGAETDGDFA